MYCLQNNNMSPKYFVNVNDTSICNTSLIAVHGLSRNTRYRDLIAFISIHIDVSNRCLVNMSTINNCTSNTTLLLLQLFLKSFSCSFHKHGYSRYLKKIKEVKMMQTCTINCECSEIGCKIFFWSMHLSHFKQR